MLLDNLEEGSTYGNGPLDSTITEPIVKDRILGVSKMLEDVKLLPTWFLTGNNISPGKDAHRRWLCCNIVTPLEHPEEREDLEIENIINYIKEHRGELLRACLVILQAHALAGYPNNWKARLGSFEEWDRLVRGAVWFATGWDCNTTRKAAAAESPEYLRKLALLDAWGSAS